MISDWRTEVLQTAGGVAVCIMCLYLSTEMFLILLYFSVFFFKMMSLQKTVFFFFFQYEPLIKMVLFTSLRVL